MINVRGRRNSGIWLILASIMLSHIVQVTASATLKPSTTDALKTIRSNSQPLFHETRFHSRKLKGKKDRYDTPSPPMLPPPILPRLPISTTTRSTNPISKPAEHATSSSAPYQLTPSSSSSSSSSFSSTSSSSSTPLSSMEETDAYTPLPLVQSKSESPSLVGSTILCITIATAASILSVAAVRFWSQKNKRNDDVDDSATGVNRAGRSLVHGVYYSFERHYLMTSSVGHGNRYSNVEYCC
jgi:hypothetical protein